MSVSKYVKLILICPYSVNNIKYYSLINYNQEYQECMTKQNIKNRKHL